MDRLRIYLICVNRLIGEGVHMVLRREGFDLVGLETDPHTALAQVRVLNPDVVVVESKGDRTDANLIMGLASLAYEKENLRIIRISLIDEKLHIYHQEQRHMATTQDLITAICAPA